MADRYWVGGGSSANWNATGNTNWGTASNTQDNASVPGASDDVFFDGVGTGASDSTLSASITVNSVNFTGYANTLTHNASITLTIDGQDGSGNSLIFSAGMTYTPANISSSAILFSGTGTSKITTNGKVVPKVVFNNSGGTFQLQDDLTSSSDNTDSAFYLASGTFDPNGHTVTFTGTTPAIRGTITFYNLYRTGTASKTDSLIFYLGASITVTNEFKVNGNSAVNRVLVYSSTLGTARTLTITGATVSNCTNVDFQDIAFVGAPDFSAITGGSGDCGGNTGATFTTADDWYWHVDGGNWSDDTKWFTATNGGGDAASVRGFPPLPQDSCFFDANSFDTGAQDVYLDMPRIGSADWTGTDNAPDMEMPTGIDVFGSFTLNSDVDWRNQYSLSFYGRSVYTVTCAGKVLYKPYMYMIGGTLTCLDTFGWTYSFSHINGTFDANDQDITASITNATFKSDGTAARAVYMGSGTWALQKWDISTTTNLTFDAETSTISMGYTGANGTNFDGGNLTYNNITIVGGTGITLFTGSNTFNTFTIEAPKTVNFTAGTTTTVSSFVATGTAVNPITITSATAALHYLIDTSGTNTVSYCTIDYSEPRGSGEGGGALWDASDGTNVDGGHNTAYDSGTNEGWKFTSPTTTTTTTTSTTTTTTSTTTTTTTTSTTTTTTSTTTTTTTTSTTTTTTSTTTTTTTTSTTTTTTSTTTTTTSTTTTTTTTSTTTTTTSTTTTTTSTTTTTTTTSTTTTTTSTTTTTTTSSTTTTTTSTTTTSTTTTSATRSYFVFEDDVIKVVVKGVLVAKFKDDGDVDVNGVANDNAF